MPRRAAGTCLRPGCKGLVHDGVCSVCGEDARKRSSAEYDAQRGTSTERGYGRLWRKLRLMFLSENPLCVECELDGLVVAATDVDHIIPKRQGGTDDWSNLQALCHSHHSQKTANEWRQHRALRRSLIPTTIVTGPPGSGKTTYVNEHRTIGDLVVDVDTLFMALGGLPWYEKPTALMPFVMAARDAAIDRLSRESNVSQAWIITSESDIDKLKRMKEELGATLIVLDVDEFECVRRIGNDDRRSGKLDLWVPIVRRWWSAWGRGDQIPVDREA